MSVKRKDDSKIVARYVGDTFFDIKMVFKKKGEGKNRRVETSTYGIFHAKHNVKDGFKTADAATTFAIENANKYNRKTHKFA